MLKEKKLNKEKRVKLSSEKKRKREKNIKILKLGLLLCTLFLIIIYAILRIIYEQGSFTVALDQNFAKKSGIVIYETLSEKESRRILEAEKLEFMDNISINWLPQNLDTQAEGTHSGENYIAYTFYVENQGNSLINYWYSIIIDDVIRNVDEAIRIMIYQNGERKIYAKANSDNLPEGDTIPFFSNKYALVEQRKDFHVGQIDKYTIVIWIEGDDPHCVDALIGGEMKMHLEITEEHKQE